MLKLNFKKKHFFTYKIGKTPEGKSVELVLVPGENLIDEKIWEKCFINGQLAKEIQIFFDKDLLSIVSEKNKVVSKPEAKQVEVEQEKSVADEVVKEIKSNRGRKSKGDK